MYTLFRRYLFITEGTFQMLLQQERTVYYLFMKNSDIGTGSLKISFYTNPMRNKISASIVVYKNDLDLLKGAVSSFLKSVEESTLYLIDNSPDDKCRKHFNDPRIKYIFNNKNIGFGAGHNIALKEVLANNSSAYHIILNPDVYFESAVTERLLSYMEATAQVGLVMPKVLYPDGRLQPLCKLLPSPFTLFTRRFLQFNPYLVNNLNHWYEMHFSGYNKVMDVPFLSGCFMFLRTDALRTVGLFDEKIFA
jgi:GT2 family glycosyltransferase